MIHNSGLLKVIILNLHFIYGQLSTPSDQLTVTNDRTQLSSELSDEYRDTRQLITSRGFQYQEFRVTTDDGYMLTIFRIINPYLKYEFKKSKQLIQSKPVLLQHGLESSSDIFLINSEGILLDNGTYIENGGDITTKCNPNVKLNETTGRTLGFVLSACGYDVWLGNSRGNSYSNYHKEKNTESSSDYWKFTFDEMAKYDTPSVINCILCKTKKKSLSYIGHSQGTTQMFALLASNYEIRKKINLFIAMAPIAYLNNVSPELKTAAMFGESLLKLYAGYYTGFSPNQTKQEEQSEVINNSLCLPQPENDVCISITVRTNESPQINESRLNVYKSHYNSASLWCIAHYAQIINTKRFAPFDSSLYNTSPKPEYPIETIDPSNIAIFYGNNDHLSVPEDVKLLKLKLETKGSLMDYYEIPDEWSHEDFLKGMDTSKYINSKILELLKTIK